MSKISSEAIRKLEWAIADSLTSSTNRLRRKISSPPRAGEKLPASMKKHARARV